MSRLFVAARAVTYMTGFVLLWGWLTVQVRRLDLEQGRSLPFWTAFVGIAFFLAGVVLVLSCVTFFVVEGKGTPAPFDAPRVFVAGGPYRFVRNPMYLGAFAVLTGVGLFLRSPSVLGLVLLAAVLAQLFVLFVEEPGLTHRFGESYLAYKRTTNRWIPQRRRAA